MKKIFQIMIALAFFLLFIFGCGGGGGGDGNSGSGREYWIEVPGVVEVSVGVSGLTFQVSVKDRDGNVQEGIFVRAEFAEFSDEEIKKETQVQEIYTDAEGKVEFLIPPYSEEGERIVWIWLPDFPKVAGESVISYIRHLKYIGPAFTGVGDVGEEDDYFDEVYPFSNIALIGDTSIQAVIGKILAASDYDQQSIVAVDHVFFNIKFNRDGVLLNIKLWPDYLERWLGFADEIQPYKDKIVGFLSLDEPWWNAMCCGISFKEMRCMIEEVAFQIKTRFPEKKVIGTICITEQEMVQNNHLLPEDAQEWYGIPENYDWVAIYYYWVGHLGDFTEFEWIWRERMQSFDEHLSPGQEIVIVPGTFSHVGLDIEQELISLAPWYIDMAKKDIRVVAIMQFLWPDHKNLVGLRSMPDLQEAWRLIGEEIVSGR